MRSRIVWLVMRLSSKLYRWNVRLSNKLRFFGRDICERAGHPFDHEREDDVAWCYGCGGTVPPGMIK